MISQSEFDMRLSRWFDMVFEAMDAYVTRVIVARLPVTDEGDKQLEQELEIASEYEKSMLPEDVLAHFLDPISPPNWNQNRPRAEAVLELTTEMRLAHPSFEVRVMIPARRAALPV